MTTSEVTLKVRLMPEYLHAKEPTYATDGSGAFDIYSASTPFVLHTNCVVHTGLQFEIPPGYVVLVFSRSGHGFKNNIRLANCVGVIDSDFRGELLLKLADDSPEPENLAAWGWDKGIDSRLTIRPGDRIAQGILFPIPKVRFEQVQELTPTIRGEGGLGSTGT